MISVQNIHKSFGKQTVLAGVNLDIPDGQITAVVGPSGVGKSVLIKLIMGILDPDCGEIFIDGENITAANSEAERNRIRASLGVLFQSAALFDSLTIYHNVAFALYERLKMSVKACHEKVTEMLDNLSLLPYASLYPQQVSLGTRKRAGLARALITEPRIVLFDEPNTGLDPLVGQEVYDLIKQCQERWGFTGVVISHELPEVFQVSDRVAMLLQGKVISEGTPEELSNSENPAVLQFLKGKIDGPIRIQ